MHSHHCTISWRIFTHTKKLWHRKRAPPSSATINMHADEKKKKKTVYMKNIGSTRCLFYYDYPQCDTHTHTHIHIHSHVLLSKRLEKWRIDFLFWRSSIVRVCLWRLVASTVFFFFVAVPTVTNSGRKIFITSTYFFFLIWANSCKSPSKYVKSALLFTPDKILVIQDNIACFAY